MALNGADVTSGYAGQELVVLRGVLVALLHYVLYK